MTRIFTAEDIKTFRETHKIAWEKYRQNMYKGESPHITMARWHDLNQGQAHVILSKHFAGLPLEEIAAKLHLVTDEINTIGKVCDLYGVEYPDEKEIK